MPPTSGHKGPGYQVQLAETCSPENEVQLITGALPQTAARPDARRRWCRCSINWSKPGVLPEEMLADTLYCGDENVQAAAARGVDLVGPVPGREPETRPRGADDRRLRRGRTDRHDRCLSRGARTDVVVARRGDGYDANRDARFGVL